MCMLSLYHLDVKLTRALGYEDPNTDQLKAVLTRNSWELTKLIHMSFGTNTGSEASTHHSCVDTRHTALLLTPPS